MQYLFEIFIKLLYFFVVFDLYLTLLMTTNTCVTFKLLSILIIIMD